MSLIKRYSIIIYGFLGVNKVLTIICNQLIAIEKFDFMMLFFAIQIILNIMCAIHLISHMVRKDKVLVFDKISGIFVGDIK